MDKKKDDVIRDFVARRTHQRKLAGERVYDEGSVMAAADEITQLYGRLAMRLSAADLFLSVRLAERALFTVLRSSVGEHHALDILRRANQRAVEEFSLTGEGVPEAAKEVFEEEKPDGE